MLNNSSIEKFIMMHEDEYIIEIQSRLSDCEIKLKNDDGIKAHTYIITETKEDLSKVFTKIKYSIYYSKQSLSNYISKYIYKKRAVAMFDYIYNPIEKLSIREIPYLLRLQRVKERGSSS